MGLIEGLLGGFYHHRGLTEEIVMGAYEDYADRVMDNNWLKATSRMDRQGTLDTEVYYSERTWDGRPKQKPKSRNDGWTTQRVNPRRDNRRAARQDRRQNRGWLI